MPAIVKTCFDKGVGGIGKDLSIEPSVGFEVNEPTFPAEHQKSKCRNPAK